ncbi:hypothetical protein SEPCBS119000_001910 [Sporothrix epigloea]|uniref:Uncharacterized protein n=1 Tax=Sporothrix epigloea TaxID=1892477 RepID=A0ABP0DH90_9PEZI
MATHMVAAAQRTFRELQGVVVSSGLMQKTVKVRVGGREWNPIVKKHFNKPQSYLVHDPNDSLRTGDVVAISPGWRMSRNKRHVVKRIIAPAQIPIEERPPVPTEEERWAEALAKRAAKDDRRSVIKEAKAIREAAEVKSKREQRKLAKKAAKDAAADKADLEQQAEELMREQTSL